jgi:hypothetical protein
MDIPLELLEQLGKGNVVLFCGAGISISEDGIPSGSQLARELAQRAGLGDVGNVSFPEVAQSYELEMGTQSLIAYVTERVDDPRFIPLRMHHLIAALPFKRIITTNWDNLLEEALRQARKPFVKVVRDESISYADDEKILLIKLHGSAEQKDTIVITGDDYYDVFARLPQVANLVQSFFATKTLLFLGYGLADEDFKRLYMEVVRHLGKHKRRAYAVQLNPTPLTVKYWEQKNVQVIAADAVAFLEALAQELGASGIATASPTAKLPSPSGASPATAPTQPVAGAATQHGRNTGQFSFERGLQVMKDALRGGDSEAFLEFSTLESRLLANIRDERLYGSTETVRSERARIVQELNRLALSQLQSNFNDLCLPAEPLAPRRPPAPADQSWRGGAEITVRGQVYVLHDPVDEAWAPDRSFVRRRAKAWQPQADRLTWLKQVRVQRATPAAVQARDALDYEGRLLARFERQPDFPHLLELEKNDEVVTIVYAFTPGPTLAQAFGPLGKPLEAGRVYRLLRSVRPLCAMLAALHREGVFHRHLTPEDVVLLEGRRDHAALQDLGLASQPRTPDEGPAFYRAPEQARMNALILPGSHTDVYQLGAVLYHFLAGRAPASLLAGIESPSAWNPSLPAELDAALLRALAATPGDRWPSADAFCAALTQAADRLRSRLRGNP